MSETEALDVTGEVISPEHKNITPLFMRHMAAYGFFAQHAEGKEVLEVGFGEGYGTDYLAGHAAHITGMDISDRLVAHARGKYKKDNLVFMQGDATRIPFADGSFDVVLSSQVLEHVRDYMAHINEVRRVLKDGGVMLAATPNRKMMLDGVNPYHYKEFNAAELKAALGKVYGSASVIGLFGSPRYMALKEQEQGFAGKILALDFLRLRRFMPRFVIRPLYRLAYEVVNRRTEQAAAAVGAAGDITVDDFAVSGEDVDSALDLIGVCKK